MFFNVEHVDSIGFTFNGFYIHLLSLGPCPGSIYNVLLIYLAPYFLLSIDRTITLATVTRANALFIILVVVVAASFAPYFLLG